MRLLNKVFRYSQARQPIDCKEIEDEIEKDGSVRTAIHRLLNYFEYLAVGVRNEVFDEELIRHAFMSNLELMLRQFQPYIDHWRATTSARVWLEMQRLSARWQEIETKLPPRPRTGAAG